LHLEVEINLSNVNFPKQQLVEIAFVIPMATIVMEQPDADGKCSTF